MRERKRDCFIQNGQFKFHLIFVASILQSPAVLNHNDPDLHILRHCLDLCLSFFSCFAVYQTSISIEQLLKSEDEDVEKWLMRRHPAAMLCVRAETSSCSLSSSSSSSLIELYD